MFSKAPFKRFNEITDDNPPPGAYDPKFKTDVADYSKGPDFERQFVNTTHGFATSSNNAFSRPASRSNSRSGSRPGSQKSSRHATPTSSTATCNGSSLERTDSSKRALKASPVSLPSQQKLITLVHKTPGDFVLHSHDPTSRPKYLRSDPHHRIIQQATKATETNMNNMDIPLSTFGLMPETASFQTRIDDLEKRLSLEIDKFNQLKDHSMEYKAEIRKLQLETSRPETASASTCTDPDMREKEILELRDSHMRISEKVTKLVEENEKLRIARDSYKIQLDLKLSTYEAIKDENKRLQDKVDETEQNWKAAEEKCEIIRKEMDECTRIIFENSSAARECPLCKEVTKLKEELGQVRERNEELNNQCEYLNKRYMASKDEWRQKEDDWNLLLKQRDREIARLTTAIATSVKNVGENKDSSTSQTDSGENESKDRILQDIKNGNYHGLDSTVFFPPCSLESQSDEEDDLFQVSPTLFVSSTTANKKSRTNLLTVLSPLQEDGPSSKESYLLKEREAIKKEMRGLTSDKQAREEQINKLGMKTNEDAKKCERVILENSRLKNILSAAHMSNVNIQFLNRKKIIPENREELHVDPYEFRRTDISHQFPSSPSPPAKEQIPSIQPKNSPSDETGDNKALNS